MNGHPAAARRRFVAGALAAASEWLIDPAEAAIEARSAQLGDRAAVAVVGLGPRAGATTCLLYTSPSPRDRS